MQSRQDIIAALAIGASVAAIPVVGLLIGKAPWGGPITGLTALILFASSFVTTYVLIPKVMAEGGPGSGTS
jgi:hypothetical protein